MPMALALTPISGAATAAKTGGVSTAMETSAWMARVAMRANIDAAWDQKVAARVIPVNLALRLQNPLARGRDGDTVSCGCWTLDPQDAEGFAHGLRLDTRTHYAACRLVEARAV